MGSFPSLTYSEVCMNIEVYTKLLCLIRSAYVEFTSSEAAKHALSLNGTSFMSRILKVYKKDVCIANTKTRLMFKIICMPARCKY